MLGQPTFRRSVPPADLAEEIGIDWANRLLYP
jgi:hypothetical protein